MRLICLLFLLFLFTNTGVFAQKRPLRLRQGDYIVIWYSGGMATPRHLTFYRLTNKGLGYDTSRAFDFTGKDTGDLNFNVPASPAAYDRIKDMPAAITPEMLGEPNKYYGKHMTDMGLYHVMAYINGIKYNWAFTGLLDQFDPTVKKFVTYFQLL